MIDAHREAGKVSALSVEEAELRGPKGFDISIPIKNGKRVAILEHAGSVVSQSGRSPNIVFIFNPDNVRQSETVPS
jgi:hypothetical protein